MGWAVPGTLGTELQWAQAAEGAQVIFSMLTFASLKELTVHHINETICSVSYIDESHDPERIVHTGILFHMLVGQDGLIYVVVCNWAVSQHASEMMDELTVIACVIPTACLWEERICNQWAHQGSEPNEEMKSLQNFGNTHDSRDSYRNHYWTCC